jgi:predicted component of type VI protein secretion system
LLLGLDILHMQWSVQRTAVADEARTRIGDASTRLGVDFIVGHTLEDEAVLKIVFGPVTLAEYRRHQTDEMKRRLELVFDLVLPCHVVRVVDWVVGKPQFTPRLATDEDNAVLGINMHLGQRIPAASEEN